MDEQGMLEGTQNENSASQPLLMDEDSLRSRDPFQRLRHTSIDTSVRQFVGDKLIVQLLDLGCQGLREKSGIDLFGDVGGAVAEQSADYCHGQTVVDGKNCECMPRGMK